MENILIFSSSENCTLILVHHTELLKQWQERLRTLLGAGKDVVGVIGGGKNRPTVFRGNIETRQGQVCV